MKKAAKYISIVFLSIGLLLVLCTLISLLKNTSHWFIQVFNFPRLQALIVLVVALTGYIIFKKGKTNRWLVAAIMGAIVVNVWFLFPYAPFAKEHIASADNSKVNKDNTFSIMLANVLMENREAQALLSLVNSKQPTILLTMEVNDWWIEQLKPLNSIYPHKVLFPTENTYGMALYSKVPLSNTRKFFFNHDSVPSFLTTVKLPNRAGFQLLTIHPVAPKASKHPDNKGDTEIGLIKAAYVVSNAHLPTIVAGDFNDVGWSPNTSKFEEISQLKDIRCGRGIYNTFDATNWVMRWPLDYIYTSADFSVVEVERLSKIGSDHFPFFAKLTLGN